MIEQQCKTYAICTLGCKVNSYESSIIKNDLDSYGYLEVPFESKADIYIINTCSVTNTADSKSRNMISRARKNNYSAIIIVCGCYSQVSSEELKDKFGINILLGNKYKNNIVDIINEYLAKNQQIIKIDNLILEKEFENSKIETYKDKTRAFVKIQDGCNFMCSYCIIPFTRGRQRSKNFNLLISEINELVSNGFKEIVLTGVNTAGYQDGEYNFYDLLLNIKKLSGNFRVRISSVEPFQISDDIVNLIGSNPNRFCQHWHICLQSGSNSVLNKMNRKYTTEEFWKLVSKIYNINPNTSISTDYIVGFPTETIEDHNNSKEFIKKVGFSKLHVFPYSKRSYTPASKLPQIRDYIKTERVNEVLEINKNLSLAYIKKFVGQNVEVLFEKEINENKYIGHASEYFEVIVDSNINLINKVCLIKIKNTFNGNAIGEFVEVIY